jgi:hypothetical protein
MLGVALAAPSAAMAGPVVTTTTVKAITIKPLSIVKLGDLDFGRMISGTAAGTVVIDPDTDGRSTTGGATAFGGAPKAAQFITYGTQGSVLQVNRGPLPVLTRAGGGATMNVTQLTLNGPITRVINPAGIVDLRVGGTLAVGANQLEGSYSGNFDIIVTYF